jgi:hypothetical protein
MGGTILVFVRSPEVAIEIEGGMAPTLSSP